MKKMILVLVICMTVFTSCTNHSIEEREKHPEESEDPANHATQYLPAEDISDVFLPTFCPALTRSVIQNQYLYRLWNGQFKRINLSTGSTTHVCTDPLCLHENSDCPFWSMSDNWLMHENMIYYITEERLGRGMKKRSFCQFSLDKGYKTVLYEIPDDGSGYYLLGIFDGQLYYVKSAVKGTADSVSSSLDYDKTFCRCRPKDFGKKSETVYVLSSEERGDYNDVYMMTDQHIYLTCAGEEGILVRTDRDFQTFERLSFPYYYIMTAHDGMYCYYQATGEDVLGYWEVTNGAGSAAEKEAVPYYGLYYTKRNLLTGEEIRLSDVPVGEHSYPLAWDDLTNEYLYLEFEDGLWRCDFDGKKLSLVWSKEKQAQCPIQNAVFELVYDGKIILADREGFASIFDIASGRYS